MGKRSMTTDELVEDLRIFQHRAASARLAKFAAILKAHRICEQCGRSYDECERAR